MEETYIYYQESVTGLNRAWRTICELETTSPGSAIWAAAYRMALIEYCKPFKRSKGISKHPLILKKRPPLPDAMVKLHEQVIDLRDTFLAHSDINRLDPKIHYENLALPLIVKNTDPNMPSVKDMRMLIEHVLDYLYENESQFVPNR